MARWLGVSWLVVGGGLESVRPSVSERPDDSLGRRGETGRRLARFKTTLGLTKQAPHAGLAPSLGNVVFLSSAGGLRFQGTTDLLSNPLESKWW
ncbi:uncharacterized protein B0H64DRAFT_71172 [Chaetomium fimeti]|jgi:hypothetical protein|uniref:Uncharacterized protein n=1 Tax=Chaetomium fimeti TaxID=1854472 RepID=A0AAE0LUZ5_9PEZI|nr:hypothetical protein B0H64DRAFT_71172 [Chaetomium fimeti]